MNLLDVFANWATGIVTAVVVAALSLGTPAAPLSSPTDASDGGILAWAQGVDEEAIQQVGESTQGDDADAEALDAGSPPVESASSDSGAVSVNQAGDDIELLDQGGPPQEITTTSVDTTAVETAAPIAVVEGPAPITTGEVVATDTTVDTRPHLPDGFGEGQVLVSTGSGDFPPGLDECHVGAVTGRAYVGIDCSEEGSTFVGHAPTFEDFPFVTGEDFPFDNDDPIVADANFPFGDDESTSTIDLNSEADARTSVMVAAGGRREAPSVSVPEGSEGAVVERAQRARGGEAAGQSGNKKSNRDRSTSISVDASSGNSSDRVQAASKDSKKSSRNNGASSKDGKNGKTKHKQKAKKNEKNDKKANKSSKSHDKGKKGKKGKKANRKKNR